MGRRLLGGTVSALAVLIAGLGQAHAAADEEPIQEVVVQGIRGSLNEALRVKRNADQFVDVISAEDIGNFPDANVAESVQRITGVQIDHDRGEGREVSIRGLPTNFTLATFNGRSLPNAVLSSAGARSFDFSVLAPEFINRLEVYKSPVADIDEGGLSGVVNVRTPRALDIGKRRLAISGQGQYESNSGNIGPRLSALYADVFADGKLGITLGLSYKNRQPETHKVEQDYSVYTEAQGLGNQIGIGNGRNKDLDGNGTVEATKRVRVPQNLYYIIFDEDVTNTSAIASVEYRPSPKLSLTFDGFYTDVDVKSVRQVGNHLVRGARSLASATSEVIDGLPTATTFHVLDLDLRSNGRFENREGYIGSGILGAKYYAGPWSFNVEAAVSRSAQRLDNLTIANDIYGNAIFTARPGDLIPSIVYLDGFEVNRLNPAKAQVRNLNGAFNKRSTDDLKDFKVDVRRDFTTSFVTSVRFGAKIADRRKFQDNKQLTITAQGLSNLYGGLPVGPGGIGTYSAAPFLQLVQAGKGTYLGSYDGDAVFPQQWLAIDTRGFISNYSDAQLIAAGTLTNDPSGITDVSEKTAAFYTRADFGTGSWKGNIGLRAVETRQKTVGFGPDLNGIIIRNDVASVPASGQLTYDRTYWDYLPSFNLRHTATDDLVLRFAASKTIARPNLGQLTPTASVDGAAYTITQNNPELDPYRATNVDIGAEWYFNRQGLLSATLFYKDIESLITSQDVIVSLNVTEVDTAGNSTRVARDFRSTKPINVSGVEVKGIEVSYQQAFTQLPAPFDGLGTVINYTYIDNSKPEALTAASKHNYNFIAYYESKRISARLSYSWRDEFLSSVVADPGLDIITQPYGTLDGSLRFKIRKGASVSLEAVNLLDEDKVLLYTGGLPADYTDAGRRIVVGFRYSF
ncbi:MAG: TonB-dependent receptor [Asticcacaulis sp.]